jgi:hypothetical protein
MLVLNSNKPLERRRINISSQKISFKKKRVNKVREDWAKLIFG